VESLINAKAPEEATPWALSVHLEERIQKLQNEKSRVNAQLDSLEASSKKLEKRLSSI
jgi:predicted nuclease with TOPRIM domain